MDETFMRLAIQLAQGVKAQTTPNPSVGVVIVKNGKVIGLGAHLQYGKAHAEVIALEMAGDEAKDAVLYSTLEPCCHYGKTPPCTELIIEKRVKRVVVACQDRNPQVAGKGLEQLENAGIEVEVGMLEREAEDLYDVFFHTVRTGLPFTTLKTAMSVDGRIATTTGESKWITNESARKDAHLYRHQHDAILVGIETVLADDPSLTTRISGGKNPIRVILDTTLRTPIDAKVVHDGLAETWIFVGKDVPADKKRQFMKLSKVRIWTMPDAALDIEQILRKLLENGVHSVLVEGGGTVNDAFLQKGFINQFIAYIAPIIIGGKNAKTSFSGKGIVTLADAFSLEVKKTELLDNQIKVTAIRKGESHVYGDC